ncbi:MAG: nitrophenyl compound nitroreductase subunit ArsF family protein [Thermogutta sp.]|nr:nitrophenyl compound nitroreductase subunit ArsF family protein [Thermogutta sp.]HPU06146.1 nitrophenyl compound nitroreductase subunit ArsF family protein [Thermogutta sp.]HPZ82903.1 nitrophenyl compound nitroreductase subunit ArsF family protein [Thermogutta sp.]HQF12661.1 nitrophenyl compound nitroreductase subunit ArsF family protein [Thermogutta sp.]
MKMCSKLVLFLATLVTLGSAGAILGQTDTQTAPAAIPPNRIIAAYFHRTQRCPTCLRVSQTVANILKAHFAEQMKSNQVQFVEIDFQAPQNAHLARAYQITGPQLVLIQVEGGRVVAWQPMPKVWSLLIKPQELDQYVTSNVEAYLHQLGHAQASVVR